jgi:hypothetical protein
MEMTNKKVLVLGGNFAGLTAALSVKHQLRNDVDVTVVSKSDRFQFNPSLILIPFGKRKAKDVVFPLAKTFESHGAEFVHGEATKIDPAAQKVETSQGVYGYDYLVIATGYLNDFEVVPGLGPGGNAYSITSLEGAVDAAEGWARLVNDPGPVVVGATQGAACFGAAYEFVFNVAYHLKKQRLGVPVAYVSAEPFAGHFGIGGLPGGEKMLGMFFKRQKIEAIWDVAMEEGRPRGGAPGRRAEAPLQVRHGRAALRRGRGGEGLRAREPQGVHRGQGHLPDDRAPQRVRGGDCRGGERPLDLRQRCRVPKTGFPAETMAHVAAENIASQIRGGEPTKEENFGDIPAVCIMDAGNNGVLILADKMLPPRKRGVMIPGPQSHAAKIAFEKYFLWKARHGYVNLP